MRRIIFFTLLFSLQEAGLAQKTGQAKIDSILALPGFQKSDTAKVKMLIDVAQTMLYLNAVKAYPYGRDAYDLAVNLKWRKGQANSLNALGLIVGDTGNNVASRKYYEQALVINREDKNNYRIITNLNNIARTYQRETNDPVAVDYFLQALKIAEEMNNDEQIALVANGLIAAYADQQNFLKAKEYAEMAVAHGEKAKSMPNVARATANLGFINMMLGDTVAAKASADRAIKIYRQLGSLGELAYAMEKRAEMDMTNIEVALPEFLAARKLFDSTGQKTASNIGNLGNIAMSYDALADSKSSPAKKKFLQDTALMFLNRSYKMALELHNTDVEQQVLNGMAVVEEKAGKPALALRHFKQFTKLRDSIFSQSKKNQIAGLQGKHDIELKDKEIAISKLEVNNQRLLVAAQRKTQIGLLVGVILFGVIGALLFWQSRQRKRTNTTLLTLNSQLDEANKVKARFFGILSHDLRGPISNLLSFLHLVKEEPELISATEQARHQKQIGRSAEELLETMESMLLWSKEQMDDFKPDIRIVPVADLFTYLEKFFGGDQRAKILFSDPHSLTVSADENYLRVIMQNLTSNALKALNNSADGLIQWEARSESGKTILAIKDNGPGLNKDQAKALYNESDGVNARNGFGFHLVRDLAKAIRYTISVDSQPGLGTTFTLAA